MTAHPGAFCSPAGGTDKTTAGTEMICSVGAPGQRARWRRNGPKPVSTPRRRRAARGGGSQPLPQADMGIDPTTGPKHAVPEAADAQKPETEKKRPPTPDEVRAAIDDLSRRPGGPVRLADLRNKLGVDDAELTKALLRMGDNRDIALEPDPDRRGLTDADRAAAIPLAGKDTHLIRNILRPDPGEQVREAVQLLAAEPGDYISLAQLRTTLPDLSRAELDTALGDLARDPNVSIVPESNQKVLTDDERGAAIHLGNQAKHLIAIRQPVDPRARERVTTAGVRAASDADLAMALRDTTTPAGLYDEIRAEIRNRRH